MSITATMGIDTSASPLDAIDFSRPFMPDELAPLNFTPVLATLTDAQRLRYNQINALYLNEQTMFFEKALARNVLGHFLSRPLPPELKSGLRQFLAEEEEHTEMFRQLNRRCAPEYYADRDFYFIQTPPLAAKLLDAISKQPERFPFLLWLMHVQEERALFFGKVFLKHADELEPHFVETQRKHLADEVGHVRWDEMLLEQVWGKTSPWLRRFNVRLFAWMTCEYFSTPKRSSLRVISALVAEFPELRPRYDEFCCLLRELGNNAAYRHSLYCPENASLTFKLFDAWPEFELMTRAMPGYRPGMNS
jgi:hypothetical protein